MDFNPQGYTADGVAYFGKDDQSFVRFFNHATISIVASKEAGRPIKHDVEMVSVIFPGEKEEVKVLANDWHRARFPKQYESFKKGQEVVAIGTPVDMLFPARPSLVDTLKQFNIHTVEQLAGVSDGAIGNIPQGRELQRQAQSYISTASGGRQFHEMQAQIEALTAQLASMKEDGFAPKAAEPQKQRAPSAGKGWPKGKPRGPRNPPAQEVNHDDIGG